MWLQCHRVVSLPPSHARCLLCCAVCVCVVVCVSRNFNHVLKTINMYTFKPAEVSALEEGGNKKARKYWLHFYDAENPREYKVDMDDPKSVLEFMKLKYEAKKWCVDQPKKEEPAKKAKKGKKKAADDEDDGAEGREGEPSKEKSDHRRADSDALKLKEPAKGDKDKARSRKSAGAAAGEGQSKAATGGSSAGGLDFLSSLDNLSFNSPAAPPAASGGFGGGGGGFGSDDFGGGGFGDPNAGFGSSSGGFGGASAAPSAGFGGGSGGFNADFDAGFGSAAAPSNGHTAFSAPAAPAPSSSGGSGGLSSLVEAAQGVKVNPQAVSSLVYQIRTIAAQFQLDAQHTQALTLQALGKIAAEPQQSAAAGGAKAGKAPSRMDAFSDLPLPADDGPGAEPDSGNPFGSDDDDDDSATASAAQHARAAAPGAAFGSFGQQQQPGAAFGAPAAHQGFGAPQGHMMQGMGGMGGFGAQQPFGAQPGGFGAAPGGFGGGGMGGAGFGAPAAQPFGAPQQPAMQQPKASPLFDQFNPF